MSIGDMDNDGDIDFVLTQGASGYEYGLSWLEMDSTKDFPKRHFIPTTNPSSNFVHAGDFNGDGFMDILTSSLYDSTLYFHMSTGAGDYIETIFEQSLAVRNLFLSDVDGDDDLDIILYGNSSSQRFFSTYTQQTDGQFQLLETQVTKGFSSIYEDLDADGTRDLVFIGGLPQDSRSIWYQAGNPDGSFADSVGIGSTHPNVSWLEVADMNGDDNPDVVFNTEVMVGGNFVSGEIKCMFGSGGGSFGLAQDLISTTYVNEVEVLDVDDDGDLDIIYTKWSFLDETGLLENDGTGLLTALPIGIDSESNANLIKALDITGNGRKDLVIGTSSGLHLYENDPIVDWEVRERISPVCNGCTEILALDLTEDSLDDIIGLSRHTGEIILFENSPDGYGFPAILAADSLSLTNVALVDINQDGLEDLMAYAFSIDAILYWPRSQDDLSYGDAVVLTEELHVNYGEVHPLDLDNDGLPDFTTIDFFDDQIYISWSDAPGVYAPRQSIESEDVRIIQLADINNDGLTDIVSCSNEPALVRVHRNLGNREFDNGVVIAETLFNVLQLDHGDIDGDGDNDILLLSGLPNGAAWLENDGVNGFLYPWYLDLAISSPYVGELIDIDLDGDLDVVTSSGISNIIVWSENAGAGVLLPTDTLQEGVIQSVQDIELIDIEGDGIPEILFSEYHRDGIGYFSAPINSGCTDPLACNYSSSSYEDDGSCCYSDCGCTDENAWNYNPTALCADQSCLYSVSGVVYFDENENGLQDEGEIGLSGRSVILYPPAIQGFTDENGSYVFEGLHPAGYMIDIAEEAPFPNNTSPDPLAFYLGSDSSPDIDFGLSDELPHYDLSLHFYPVGQGYPCDAYVRHDIIVNNTSNLPLDGLIQLEYDSLFQGVSSTSSIDSLGENRVYLSYENLPPGQSYYTSVLLWTPTAEHIGTFLSCTIQVWGLFESDTVAYGIEDSKIELTCAYDPNDKQVFPAGYTDAHYVPEEDYLEYLVRFQNTGNAPATDVIIRDTIDEGLEISTFQLVANSHSVFTTVDPATREVEFYFQDIQLPDSVNNEPESHGLVSFKIRPAAELPLLTELNNTAAIFFDNNPPIVTNTTWSTIYNCSLFEVSFTDDGAILTASEGDSYQWYMDGEPIDGATFQIFEAFENGEYAVEVSNDFPCSELTASVFVLVDAIDELADSRIVLFPNPMTSSAILDLGDIKGLVRLEIYDLKGELLRTEQHSVTSEVLEIHRGTLVKGKYLLQIVTETAHLGTTFIVR